MIFFTKLWLLLVLRSKILLNTSHSMNLLLLLFFLCQWEGYGREQNSTSSPEQRFTISIKSWWFFRCHPGQTWQEENSTRCWVMSARCCSFLAAAEQELWMTGPLPVPQWLIPNHPCLSCQAAAAPVEQRQRWQTWCHHMMTCAFYRLNTVFLLWAGFLSKDTFLWTECADPVLLVAELFQGGFVVVSQLL